MIKKIKLPKIETFAGKTQRSASPFEKFHFWVAKKLGGLPKGRSINVSASVLNAKDYEKLERLVVKWAKLQMPWATEQRIKLAVGMHNLDIGPAADKKVAPGYVYVKETEIFTE